MGVVVRDDSSKVMAAMAKVVPYINDPIVAEVVAAWRAITFCCT